MAQSWRDTHDEQIGRGILSPPDPTVAEALLKPLAVWQGDGHRDSPQSPYPTSLPVVH